MSNDIINKCYYYYYIHCGCENRGSNPRRGNVFASLSLHQSTFNNFCVKLHDIANFWWLGYRIVAAFFVFFKSYHNILIKNNGAAGFRSPYLMLAKHPLFRLSYSPFYYQPQVGIEPTTFRLLSECSANWAIVAICIRVPGVEPGTFAVWRQRHNQLDQTRII